MLRETGRKGSARKDQFLEHLSLREGMSDRTKHVAVAADNCLSDGRRALHLIFVDDYGTVGLHGNPHSRQSHFHRLLLTVGDSTKALATPRSGGSYGYGKSALSLNSRLRTIVAYSRFEPDETGSVSRLMGCTYLDAHEFKGGQWTGRGWFGRKRAGPQIVVDPLRDNDADEWAEKFGFVHRGHGDHGTSILIVDSQEYDPRALLKGVEEWWWPRLIDQELEVVVQVDGEELYPQPKRRQDILPYIECYSIAVGRSQPTGSHQRSERFNRHRGLSIGTYSFQVMPSDRADELSEERIGSVATIRSPKMVVDYFRIGRSSPAAVGIFVADPDIDEILKLSEPPNHDRWDPDSRRLEVAKPDESTARDVVNHVAKRLKDQMRRFQAQATPPKPREPKRIRFLERELAALFRPQSGNGDHPEAEAGPVEIRFRDGPAVERGSSGLRATAKVAMRLRSDAEVDTADVVLRVRVPILEDENGAAGDLLPVTIRSVDLKPEPSEGSEPDFRISLSKSEWFVFTVRSAPYDPGWSTRVDVQVGPSEPDE